MPWSTLGYGQGSIRKLYVKPRRILPRPDKIVVCQDLGC